MMTEADRQIVMTLTGCKDTGLIDALLAEAEARILGLCGRTHLIDPLVPAVRELAICMYNRMGSEGMASRSDGEIGISSAFTDIPETIRGQVQRYRLARVGGRYHEATQTEP